jgi:hypothetical protein
MDDRDHRDHREARQFTPMQRSAIATTISDDA